MIVYGDINSGNCYKVKLLLTLLGIEHQWQHVDIIAGETKSDNFLSINPSGKIPVVVFDDGKTLTESNAILSYFAKDTEYLPNDRFLNAKVYQWMFFEQYSHEPFVAVARFIKRYLGLPDDRKAQYESLQEGGNKALQTIEIQLENNQYLVTEQLTIADIALYAYTHVADEGGFDLNNYPNTQAWCKRISETDGYVSMC
ncbi:glutathione S-transferase family protein [Thalassotalea crassostreae]|uniref:glutathione S-transferase family protein n=1 Tax=Thalassotalea crassostreae TaxID=1763536 RepID=UPI00083905E1|nr:glutathione S-transferase family protein [Thalassotalea crassostreae]